MGSRQKKRKRQHSQAKAKSSVDVPSPVETARTAHTCDPQRFDEYAERQGKIDVYKPLHIFANGFWIGSTVGLPHPCKENPSEDPRTTSVLVQGPSAPSDSVADSLDKVPVPQEIFGIPNTPSNSVRVASGLDETVLRPQPAIDWSILNRSSYMQPANESTDCGIDFGAFTMDPTVFGSEFHNFSDEVVKTWIGLNSTFNIGGDFAEIQN